MNSRKVREEVTYPKFQSDKESYWFAHTLTSTPYHFVPGYSGGLGRITHPVEGNVENLEKEHLCTLQLLHVLEFTREPFWISHAIVEYLEANDAAYIIPEGWVGHDGRWHSGGQRFPNEFCVEMPQSEWEGLLGHPEPVRRVEGELKSQLERIIQEAEKYDDLMEAEALIKINRETIVR